MGIQDNIFDVYDALEDKPVEWEQFDTLVNYIGRLESENDELIKNMRELHIFKRAVIGNDKKVAYIAKGTVDGTEVFLTARRSTGSMYVNRAGWSEDFSDAKVFSTRGAATNSANQTSPDFDVEIKEVYIVQV